MFLISAGSRTSELDTTNTILYFLQNIEREVFRKWETYTEMLDEMYSDETVDSTDYVR